MTTLTWTQFPVTTPGWTIEFGTLSQDINQIDVTQSVSNWQYPEVLLAFGQDGRQFLGYCEVYVGNLSGTGGDGCTLASKQDGSGMDYTLSISTPGIDKIELTTYGATGLPTAHFAGDPPPTGVPEPSTAFLMIAALCASAAAAMTKRAIASIDFAAHMS